MTSVITRAAPDLERNKALVRRFIDEIFLRQDAANSPGKA